MRCYLCGQEIYEDIVTLAKHPGKRFHQMCTGVMQEWDNTSTALAASQAESAELRAAGTLLADANTADGVCLPLVEPDEFIRRLTALRALLARPTSDAALRAFGERVAVATLSKWHVQPDRMFADEAAAIVTRILSAPKGETR